MADGCLPDEKLLPSLYDADPDNVGIATVADISATDIQPREKLLPCLYSGDNVGSADSHSGDSLLPSLHGSNDDGRDIPADT